VGVRAKFGEDLPSKSQIFDYWKDHIFDLGLFIDWGEPSCWACGFHYGTKYDIKRSDASWEEIYRCWERVPLQRCHIVPRSIGGSDDVANLFLMCRECHDTAPNTNTPEIFFEWAKHQSFWRREANKIDNAFNSFGVASSEQESLAELIGSKEFRTWISGKFGLHWPQSNYAPVSSRLTLSTIVGLAVEFQRMNNGLGKTRSPK
jgi:HNH endonuclease